MRRWSRVVLSAVYEDMDKHRAAAALGPIVEEIEDDAELGLNSSIVDTYDLNWNEADVSFDSTDGDDVINQFLGGQEEEIPEEDIEHYIFGCGNNMSGRNVGIVGRYTLDARDRNKRRQYSHTDLKLEKISSDLMKWHNEDVAKNQLCFC